MAVGPIYRIHRGNLENCDKLACSCASGFLCCFEAKLPFKLLLFPSSRAVKSVCSACGGTRAKSTKVFEEEKSMVKSITSVICLALIFILVLPCPAWAWSGKVISVADGDTITVLHEKRPERIRLYGIDCPEKRQPFGKKAKKFTSELVFGKIVEIDPVDTDRYGRNVAFVRVENVTLNEELIKKGLAWVYERYCKLPVCNDRWDGLEREARSSKQGIWQDSNVIPPWEFRRYKRKHVSRTVSFKAN
jgi:endonuclease YncB( thermonuclease family)